MSVTGAEEEEGEGGRVILWLNMATAVRDGKRVRAGAGD